MQRSYEKRVTRDAQILRHMRLTRRMSLTESGKSVHISGSAVAHIEHGRMDVSKARIETMVKAYGYTMAEYMEYFDGKALPRNLRDECILLLRQCDESKIQMLHPVISNLAK